MPFQSSCGDDAEAGGFGGPDTAQFAAAAGKQSEGCAALQSPTEACVSLRGWRSFTGSSATPPYARGELQRQAGSLRQISMKFPDLEPDDLPHDFLEAFAARLAAISYGQLFIGAGAARRGCVIIVLDVIGPWQPQATLAAASAAASLAAGAGADAGGLGASAAHVLPPPLAALLAALPVQRQPGMRVVFRQPPATQAAAAAAAGAGAAAGAAAQERVLREAGVVVEWAGPEQGWRVLPAAAVPALPAGAYAPPDMPPAAAAADAGGQLLPVSQQLGANTGEGSQWLPLEGSLSLRCGPLPRPGPADSPAAPVTNPQHGLTSAPNARQQPPRPPAQCPSALQHPNIPPCALPTSLMIPTSGGGGESAAAAAGTAAAAAAATHSGQLRGGSYQCMDTRVAGATSTGGAAASPSPPSSGGDLARHSPPAHILCSLRGMSGGAAAAYRSKGSEAGGVGGRWPLQSAAGACDAVESTAAGRVRSAGGAVGVAPVKQLFAQHRAKSFGGSGTTAAVLVGGLGSSVHARGSGTASHIPSGGSTITSTGSTRMLGVKPSRTAGSVDSGSGSGGSSAAAAVAVAAAVAAAAAAGGLFRRRARSASVPYGHPNGVRALLETHHEHGEEPPSPPRRKRADTPGPQSGPAASGQSQAPAAANGADGGRAAGHGGASRNNTRYGDDFDTKTSDTAVRDVTRSTAPPPAAHATSFVASSGTTVALALNARPAAAHAAGTAQSQGGRMEWGHTVSGGVVEVRGAPPGLRWSGAAPATAPGGGGGSGGQGGAQAAAPGAAAPAVALDAARPALARTRSYMRPRALAAAMAPAADAAVTAAAAVGAGSGFFSSGLHPGSQAFSAAQSQSLSHGPGRHLAAPPQPQPQPQPSQPGSSMASRLEWGAVNTDLDLLWSSPRPWAVGGTPAPGPRRGPLQPGAAAGGQRLTPYVSSGSAAAAMAAATALVASQGAPQRQRSAARHLPVTAAGGAGAGAAQDLASSASNVPTQALDTGFTEACAWLMQTQRPTPPQPHSQSHTAQKPQLQQSFKQQQARPPPPPPQQQLRKSPLRQLQQQQRPARPLRPEQALREAQRMRLLWRGGSGEAPARVPSSHSAGSDDADLLVLDEALASLVAEYQHPHTESVADAAGGGAHTAPSAAEQGGAAAGGAAGATAAAAPHRQQPPARNTRPQLRLQEASEGEPELEQLLLGGPGEPQAVTPEAGSLQQASEAPRPATRAPSTTAVSASERATTSWVDGMSITAVAAGTAAAAAAAPGAATASSGINSGSGTGGLTSSAVAVAPLGFAAAAAAAVTASQSSGGPGTGAGAVVDTSMSIAAAVGASGLMSLSQPAAPFLKVRHPPAAAADAPSSASTAALTSDADALDTAGSAAGAAAAAPDGDGCGAAAAAAAAAQPRRSPSGVVLDRAEDCPPVQVPVQAAAAAAAAAAGTAGEEAPPGSARIGSGTGSGKRPGGEPPGAHFSGQYQTYGASAYCDSFWATTIPEATGEGSLESSGGHQANTRTSAAAAADATAAAAVAVAAAAAASAVARAKGASEGGAVAMAAAAAGRGAAGPPEGTAVRVGGGGRVLRALSSGLEDADNDAGGLDAVDLDAEDAAEDAEEGAELGGLLSRVSSGTIRRVAMEAMEGNWLGGSDGEQARVDDEFVAAAEGGSLAGPSSSVDSRSSGRWGAGRGGRGWSGRGPPPPSGHVTSAEDAWGTSGGGTAGRAVDQLAPAAIFAALPDAAAAPLQPLSPPGPVQPRQPPRQQQQPTLSQPAYRPSPSQPQRRASYRLRRSTASYGAAADLSAMAQAVAAATGLDSVMIFTDADTWAHSPWDDSAAVAAAAGAAGGAAGEAAVAAAILAMGPPTLEPAALVPPPTPMSCVSLTVHGLPPTWAAAPPPTSGADLGAGGGGGGGGAGPSAWRRSSALSTMSAAAGAGAAGGGGGGGAAANAAAVTSVGGAGGSYWGMLTTFVSPPGDEVAAAAAAAAAANGASPAAGGSGGGADGAGGGLLVAVRCAGRYLPVQWTWRHQRAGAAAEADGGAGGGGAAVSPALELSVSGLMGQGLLVVEVWYGGVYYASLPAVVTYDPRLVDDLLGRHAAAAGTSISTGSSRHPRHHAEHAHGSRARQHRGGAAAEPGRAGADAAPRVPVPDDVVYDLGIWLQYVASTAPLSRREAVAAVASAAAAGAAGGAAAFAAPPAGVAQMMDEGFGRRRAHQHASPATAASTAEARMHGSTPTPPADGHTRALDAPAPAPAPRRTLMDTAATFHLGGPQTTTQARGGAAAAAAAATAGDAQDARMRGASAGGYGPLPAAASPPVDGARPGSDASLLHVPMHVHDEQDPDPMMHVLQPSDVLRYTTAAPGAGGLEPWLPRSGDTTTMGSSQIFSSSSVTAFTARARTAAPLLPPAPVFAPPTSGPLGAVAAAAEATAVTADLPTSPVATTVVASATNVAMSVPADFEAAFAATAASNAGSRFPSEGTAFSTAGLQSHRPLLHVPGAAPAAAAGGPRATAAATIAALAEPLAALAPSGGSGGADDGRGLGAIGTTTTAIDATSSSMLDSAPQSRRRICHDSAVDMTVPILPGSVDMSAAVATLQRGPAYGQQMQELAVGLLAWLVFAGRPVAAAVVLRGLMGHRALRFTEVAEEVRRLGTATGGAAARGAGGGGIPGMGGGVGPGGGGGGGEFAAAGYGGMGLLHLAIHSGRREMIDAVVGWSAALSPVSQAAGGSNNSNGSHNANGVSSRTVGMSAVAAAGLAAARPYAAAGLPASEWCELCAAGVGPLHLAAALVMPAAAVAVGAAPDGGGSRGAAAPPPAPAAVAAVQGAGAAAPGPEGVDAAGLDTLVWLLSSFPETRALWGSARDAYGTTPGAILSYYLRSLPPASADAVRHALVPLVGPEPTWSPPSPPLPSPPPHHAAPGAYEMRGHGHHQQQQQQQGHGQRDSQHLQLVPEDAAAAELQPAWARRLFQEPPQVAGGTARQPEATPIAVREVAGGEADESGVAGVYAAARAVAGEAAELGAVPAALRLARIARLLTALAAATLREPHAPPAGAPGATTRADEVSVDAIRVALGLEVQLLLRGLLLQLVADPAPVMLVAMALLAMLVVRVWDVLSPPGRQ
ncbi:hypothetical protein HXX76_007040 [Chlamydomonas incerta]|uniref:Uncharacterized protein n=1 Tax=Chlamydomonas incerta TaxID=51695 RepID=A0A835TDB5_CHLIN|nr:hypothetical protein HXX76_007040 [Chlamydomonas incerta]|eukprot:KAG2435845.1 hypothetical protein HXX76_007040 [Chlamydomonas incerta]